MPLVTTKEMFRKAYDGGYAIGAFNVNNMEIVQGITEAAQELKAPLILQVSKGARAYANHTYLVKLVEAAAHFRGVADRLKKDGFLTPVLVGNVEEVKAAAAKGGFNIEGLEIIDPLTYDKMDEMVDAMVALRKGKMTPEECRELLKKGNYFGTMLVKMGVADSLLGGATYSTADTVRPALQLIKTRPGAHLVSSCFILQRGEELLAMGDCAINISYEDSVDKEGNVTVSAAQKLAEVAIETARTAKIFGIDPKVCLLYTSDAADE